MRLRGVLFTLMAEAESIPDIADIVDPSKVDEPVSLWLILAIIGGVLLLIGIVAFLVIWLRRRPAPPPLPPDPLQTAVDTLHDLKQNYSQTPPAVAAETTYGALRSVLGARFGIGHPSQTDSEFFERNQQPLESHFEPGRREQLRDLLKECASLRFAPTPESPSARLPLAESALDFLRNLPPLKPISDDADSPPA